MLSFPAGLIHLINSQPNSVPPITFRIKNFQSLENVTPNKQVLYMSVYHKSNLRNFLFIPTDNFFSREQNLMSEEPVFHFNMAQLTLLLKRQAEQNPSASYFNVDILKVCLFFIVAAAA